MSAVAIRCVVRRRDKPRLVGVFICELRTELCLGRLRGRRHGPVAVAAEICWRRTSVGSAPMTRSDMPSVHFCTEYKNRRLYDDARRLQPQESTSTTRTAAAGGVRRSHAGTVRRAAREAGPVIGRCGSRSPIYVGATTHAISIPPPRPPPSLRACYAPISTGNAAPVSRLDEPASQHPIPTIQHVQMAVWVSEDDRTFASRLARYTETVVVLAACMNAAMRE